MAYNPNFRAMGLRPRFGARTNDVGSGGGGGATLGGGVGTGAIVGTGTLRGEEPLPPAPVDASGEGPNGSAGGGRGWLGPVDTQQGSNPWSNAAMGAGDVMSGGNMDELRRRMRMRGIAGGGAAGGAMGTGDLMGGGFEGAMSPTAMVASGPVARGRATYQQRTPQTATDAARQALAAAAQAQAVQHLPEVGDPAPDGGVYQSPMPVVEMDHSRDYKGSPMGGGGQLPTPTPAPAPTPAPTGPATVPVGVPPNDQTMYAKNGGRARRLGLGKFAGASRGKRSPVTFDAKGNVLMAEGGKITWQDLLAGRDAFGRSGGDIMNTLARIRSGDQQYDPLLAHYIAQSNDDEGGGRYKVRGSDRLQADGTIMIGGVPYVQIGDKNPDEPGGYNPAYYRSRDPSLFKYDEEFGGLTRADNMNVPESALDRYMPAIVAAGFGGAALSAAGGGGAAVGAGESAIDTSLMQPLVQGTYTPIAGDVALEGAGAASTGAVDTSLIPSLEGGSYTPIADTPVFNAPVVDPYEVDFTANHGEPFESGYPETEGGFDATGGGNAGAGANPNASRGNFLSRISDWARSNPTSAIRAASGLGSAFGGRGGGGVPQVTVDPVTVNAVTPEGGGNPLARADSTNAGGGEVDPATDPLAFLQSSSGGGNSMSSWSPQSAPRSEYIQKILDEAEKAGSPEEQEAVAGRAAADAAQRAARAKEAMTSRLVSQGINPNDPRGAAGEIQRLADLDNSKASVGAQNVARSNEKDKGFSRRAAAAGLALQDDAERGRAQLAQQQLSMESARAAASERQSENALRARMAESALDRQYRSGESAAERAWRTGESATDRTFRAGESAADRNLRAQQINAGIAQQNSANGASRARNIGSAFGAAASMPWGSWYNTVSSWFADGGRVACKGIHRANYAGGGDVEGPGTSTSDSIDAKLSDGEFVVNAEGVELLDKLAPGFLEKANDRGMRLRRVRSQGLRGAA